MRRLNYSLLSKYRSQLMGVAIIFIMFCHSDVAQSHNRVAVTGLARALHIFTVGVDIFLFLSGMGLYFSYIKRKPPYLLFQKKRMIRIFPAYFIIGGMTYLIYDLCLKHLSIGNFLNDLFFITWFRGKSTRYWYIITIAAFYLLFPVLYQFIYGRNGKSGLLRTVLFSFFWCGAVELLASHWDTIASFRIALERLPVFLIGVYIGELVYDQKEINKAVLIAFLLTGYIAFIILKLPLVKPISSYLYYPVRGLLAISIIFTLVKLMEVIDVNMVGAKVIKLLGWFGTMSLELYLLHQSYMILLEYPYKLTTYPVAAFIFPTVTAVLIYTVRNKIKKKQSV